MRLDILMKKVENINMFSLEDLTHFGAFFGMIADFNEQYDKLSEEDMRRVGGNMLILMAKQGGDASDYLSTGTKIANFGSASWSALSRNLVSKTYLKGLADFMEVLTSDDTSKWKNYKNSKLGSYYPNVFAKLVNDPFYKDTKSILDEAKKRTGVGEVEDKYDFRGNKLKMGGTEGRDCLMVYLILLQLQKKLMTQ